MSLVGSGRYYVPRVLKWNYAIPANRIATRNVLQFSLTSFARNAHECGKLELA